MKKIFQNNWFIVIAGIMLILAILPIWPYGYFQFLRRVVSIVSVYSAYVAYEILGSATIYNKINLCQE